MVMWVLSVGAICGICVLCLRPLSFVLHQGGRPLCLPKMNPIVMLLDAHMQSRGHDCVDLSSSKKKRVDLQEAGVVCKWLRVVEWGCGGMGEQVPCGWSVQV